MGLPIGLVTSQKREVQGPPGPPFVPGSADNGTSLGLLGEVVLGQDVGAVGNPAGLFSSREIPTNGFFVAMSGIGNLLIGSVVDMGQPLQVFRNNNGSTAMLFNNPNAGVNAYAGVQLQSTLSSAFIYKTSSGYTPAPPDSLVIQDKGSGGIYFYTNASVVGHFFNNGNFLLDTLFPADNGNKLQVSGSISQQDVGAILHATAAMNNGAGVSAGTLLNAPAAGNPTKWLPFDDAGVTRFIPSW